MWANKNDLSLSSGNNVSFKVKNLIDLLDSFKENILCDHTEKIWAYFNELKEKRDIIRRIDIVLDNCSIELAADLLLCDFLLRNDFVDEIKLHGKAFYWFISDVTQHDFDFLLKQVQSSNSLILNNFNKRLDSYLSEGKLKLDFSSYFWTSPYPLHCMERIAPDLYSDMKTNSSLVILKGDLNYRKLLGDLDWPHNTPLREAVQNFLPTSLCAVRTLKADLVAGLDTYETSNPRYGKLDKSSAKWMITGDYGIIQFLNLKS